MAVIPTADIDNRAEIVRLLDAFYSKALEDDVIGYLFTEVAQLDLATHLPILTDFWEDILFRSGKYRRNPMVVHQQLHAKSPLRAEHFDRWVVLFEATVDEMFHGPFATLAKQRARSIATVMQIKVNSNS